MMIDIFSKIDLLTVGVASVATGILGFVIFFNNRRSITSRTFLIFSLVTIFWGVINYGIYVVNSSYLSLWFTRLVMFSAVWQAFFIYQLFKVFPDESYVFSKRYKYLLFPLIIFTSIITLTPVFFSKIISYTPGSAPIVAKGPGLILFALVSVGLIIRGLSFLVKKTALTPVGKKEPFILIFVGTFFTFLLIISLNFILPSFFNVVDFIPLGALFTFPFILFTSYAIVKHKLLDIKILSTEILSFALIIMTFFEVLVAKSVTEVIFRLIVFIALFIFSVFLIKSVIKEVKQREQLEVLSKELQTANARLQEIDRQKTDFLSIAAHQLRTPLSVLNGYIELIKDGAYGKVGKGVKDILHNMDESNGHLIKLIDEFLDITRIEQGRTKYDYKTCNINEMIDGAVKELTQRAQQADFKIVWHPGAPIEATYDDEKIRHVVYNFIDNAIKYGIKGKIEVICKEKDEGVEFTVTDHGYGFGEIDGANFFQKFYRGENVKHTNVTGTGLGLYVCKKFIEGHGGRIWGTSPGLKKGSEFGFWIPKGKKN